jgi:hypothetical protein
MPSAAEPAATRSEEDSAIWRGRAFGLAIESFVPLTAVTPGGNRLGARQVALEPARPGELERAWRAGTAETVEELRFPDSRTMVRIEQHPAEGFCLWAPRHGRYVVSADGRRVRMAVPGLRSWRWQRLLFAQVLPLAATLQGLEPLHASAVALGGSAVAFLASSGGGKTSVAVHLVGRGADLLTDDVLSVEASVDGVLAHPGAGLVNIDPRDLARLGPGGRARLGATLGEGDRVHVAAPLAAGPRPLRAIYFLRRGDTGRRPRIVPHVRSDARCFLAGTFVRYVRSPERLRTHLEVCARLASSVPAFDLLVPERTFASDVGGTVERHVERLRRPAP